MTKQTFSLTLLAFLLALLTVSAAAQATDDVKVIRGQKQPVDVPFENKCTATHVFEMSAGPATPWLSNAGKRPQTIAPATIQKFSFVADGAVMEVGAYTVELPITCLDCASDPKCMVTEPIRRLRFKVVWSDAELAGMAGHYVERQVLVSLEPGSPDEIRKVAEMLATKHQLSVIEILDLRAIPQTLVLFSFLNPQDSVPLVLPKLWKDTKVRFAAPNLIYRAFGAQERDYEDEQYGPRRIKADLAQRHSTGRNVRVALLDTGVDETHRDLKGRIAEKVNFTDHPGYAQDRHGTMLAGIIAAKPRDRFGITGIAPDAKISLVKVLKPNANATEGFEGTAATVEQGVNFAIEKRVHVINMSFGSPEFDPYLAEALRKAVAQGIVVVAAAGNKERRSIVMYPAALDEVIAVCAVGDGESSYPLGNRGQHLDVAAPGVEILSTAPGGTFNKDSGTSYAAAHVTGVVALLLGKKPKTTPKKIKEVLETNSTDLGVRGRDNEFGSGLVDACKALEALVGRGQFCR